MSGCRRIDLLLDILTIDIGDPAEADMRLAATNLIDDRGDELRQSSTFLLIFLW